MRAVVVHGPGDVRVDERARPVPGAGEVLLALEWGGICGSDIAYWKKGASGTAALTHPLVLGHEFAGRIAALGNGVTGLREGQPVTVHPAQLVGDGVLPGRIAGRTNLYPRVRYFGSAAFDPHTDGGFSEYRAVPAAQIRPLPDGVGTEQGALAEPLAVALHAVGRAPELRGRTVLVNGCGPIGSLVVAAARYRGAGRVVAADLASSSSPSPAPWAPTRRATCPQATRCPRTWTWSSRRPAPRPRSVPCSGPRPGEAPSSRWETCPVRPWPPRSATS